MPEKCQVFHRNSDGKKVDVRPSINLMRQINSDLRYVRARPRGAKTWNTWESNAFLREHTHPRGIALRT